MNKLFSIRNKHSISIEFLSGVSRMDLNRKFSARDKPHNFRRFFFSQKVKLDPYLILEVNRSADWKTIKLSYFKLARLYHPDLNKNDEVTDK